LTITEVLRLPASIDLRTAADALGMSIATAYTLVRKDRFPCAVLRPGHRYRVPTSGLRACLGIEDAFVHMDDVERGAAFAEQDR